MSLLSSHLASAKVVLVLGSGGVGKTTTATLLAIMAAQQGRRVALLSIDPAKRLADAMGLKLGATLTRVPLKSGELFAAMLDQKAVFDEMVRRYAPTKLQASIHANRVYQEISTHLAGPLEYLAVAKLEELVSQERYDLVVLDTPPDTHAIDFLTKPNLLQGFMENRVMTWLVKPFYLAKKLGLGRLMASGERLMGGIAKVTGVSALQTLAEFLVLMDDVIQGMHRSGQKLQLILKDQRTHFTLVCGPHRASFRSASGIMQAMAERSWKLQSILYNRAFPQAVADALNGKDQDPATNEVHQILLNLAKESRTIRTLIEEKASQLGFGSALLTTIEDQNVLPLTLEGLESFAATLS